MSRAQAILALCELLTPGSTVYCITRRTTRTGLQRSLDFFADYPNSGLRCISPLVAQALEMPTDRTGALIVRGWGENAPQSVLMNLSYALHGTSGKGLGLVPNGICNVADADNYRAGYSLKLTEL